jgi:hypothetical protein
MCNLFIMIVGGIIYPKNYRSIAYPLYQSPHGGIWKQIPNYYKDYENELNERLERERRSREARNKEYNEKKARDFWSRFFGGFFGFDEEPEILEPDYPYNVFGLKKSASSEDMKKAYRKAVLKAHPDRGGTNEAFRKVREAWDYFKSVIMTL